MQVKKGRRPNAMRSAEMRQRLVDAARALFLEQGFAGTSTPAIVSAAGVTRGALYHHFADKQALFKAVLEQEAEALAKAVQRSDQNGLSAKQRLVDGAMAYVDGLIAPGRAKLMFVEGPAVLGARSAQLMEAERGEAQLRIGLSEALGPDRDDDLELEYLARLLSAMFERAAVDIDEGLDPNGYRRAIKHVLSSLSARP